MKEATRHLLSRVRFFFSRGSRRVEMQKGVNLSPFLLWIQRGRSPPPSPSVQAVFPLFCCPGQIYASELHPPSSPPLWEGTSLLTEVPIYDAISFSPFFSSSSSDCSMLYARARTQAEEEYFWTCSSSSYPNTTTLVGEKKVPPLSLSPLPLFHGHRCPNARKNKVVPSNFYLAF